MERKVEYSAPVSSFATVSTIIYEEGNERLLVIELNHGGKIVFRGDDIAALHDAFHECENVIPNLEMTLRAGIATKPAPYESERSQAVLAVLQELADGNRLCYDSIKGVWSVEGVREVNLYGASGLELGGFVEAISQSADKPPSRTFYTISDIGRRLLAAQEGDDD